MSNQDLPICTTCGSQYDAESGTTPSNCKICDDPRQFVPPAGQQWTTLHQLTQSHRNTWYADPIDPRITSFSIDPKFAIGQRTFLLQTSHGNVLWDMIANLDSPTISKIHSLGGLKAIVISHPHYYTTYVEWAETFNCPIYVGADDQEWLCRKPPLVLGETVSLIEGPVGSSTEVLPGVRAIKTGGHFPGSLVLHWEKKLFIADTIITVPSAHTPHPRPPGQTSYGFYWSIPNMIPLPPDEIFKIWKVIRGLDFDTTYGAFVGMDVRDKELKGRMLGSMKIQVRGEGWREHEILGERAV